MKYYKKSYCINCGKHGHRFKKCIEPITSLGIVAFKIDFDGLKKDLNINLDFDKLNNTLNNMLFNINILKFNNENINLLEQSHIFKKYIKFLIISRKHSLGYIEFIKGNYDITDNDSIIKLFVQMTPDEIIKLKTKDYEFLWNNLWNLNELTNNTIEYLNNKMKFNKLKENNLNDLLNNIKLKYNIIEWGFPKGKRNKIELNIDTAKREFIEETNIKKNDFILLYKILPLVENLLGTNNIDYKHIYYLALCKNDLNVSINKDNNFQINEIGDIGWFTYDVAIKMLRSYHIDKKKTLTDTYMFIIIFLLLNK